MGIWVASNVGLLQKMLQWTVLYSLHFLEDPGTGRLAESKHSIVNIIENVILTDFVFLGGSRVLAWQIVFAPLRSPWTGV